MAKIKLTQKNFSKALSEHFDNLGADGLIASALLGGKDKLKDFVKNLPDEQTIWVDTKYVVAVSDLTRVAQTGDVVFGLMFAYPVENKEKVWIKGDEYEHFLEVWTKEE